MNYSRNLRKAAMAKRVLISWLIVALVGGLIGSVSGYVLGSHMTANRQKETVKQTNEQSQKDTILYGAYSYNCFTNQVTLDWGGEDLNFIPLNVDMDNDLQEFIYCLSAAYNIDFSLVMAVIQYESSFDPNAISSTYDYGLMQINEVNHEYLTETIGISDFLNPYQNVMGGVYVLRKLFERYEDTYMVLMAYNMGEDGAKRLWDQGIYETNYTSSIMNIQQQYNEQLGR